MDKCFRKVRSLFMLRNDVSGKFEHWALKRWVKVAAVLQRGHDLWICFHKISIETKIKKSKTLYFYKFTEFNSSFFPPKTLKALSIQRIFHRCQERWKRSRILPSSNGKLPLWHDLWLLITKLSVSGDCAPTVLWPTTNNGGNLTLTATTFSTTFFVTNATIGATLVAWKDSQFQGNSAILQTRKEQAFQRRL